MQRLWNTVDPNFTTVLVVACVASLKFMIVNIHLRKSYEKRWRHTEKRRTWRKRKEGAQVQMVAAVLVVVVLGALVVSVLLLVLVLGDKNEPNDSVRKVWNWDSLVKTITLGVCLLVPLSNVKTAAWNQALPTLHINGPPESP